MHGHGREFFEVIGVVLVALVAAVWYLVGRLQSNSDTKRPPDAR